MSGDPTKLGAERPNVRMVRRGTMERTAAILQEVQAERRRQVEALGYTTEHDLSLDPGELAIAAGTIALTVASDDATNVLAPEWARDDARKLGTRTCLLRAMAMLCAEIDALDQRAGRR